MTKGFFVLHLWREKRHQTVETWLACKRLRTSKDSGIGSSGPTAATLGQDEGGNSKGGLLWVKNSSDAIEVIACNLDENQNLMTTYRESSDRSAPFPPGQSCLEVIMGNDQGDSLKLDGPAPIPQSGDDGDGPLLRRLYYLGYRHGLICHSQSGPERMLGFKTVDDLEGTMSRKRSLAVND